MVVSIVKGKTVLVHRFVSLCVINFFFLSSTSKTINNIKKKLHIYVVVLI